MSRPDQYYPDGFRGGSELPDHTDIDQMVFPERKPEPTVEAFPIGLSTEQWQAEKDKREADYAMECFERDRAFTIEEGNVTGQHPGPPRTP